MLNMLLKIGAPSRSTHDTGGPGLGRLGCVARDFMQTLCYAQTNVLPRDTFVCGVFYRTPSQFE